MKPFQLHPQLASDTLVLGDLALCRVLLMNDRRFPWLVLVPMREGMKELIDLVPGDQALLLDEINHASRTLQRLFRPEKLNVAALGNMVPQLHIHILARFKNDIAWPKPVWGIGAAAPYNPMDKEKLMDKLQAALQLALLKA